MTLLDDAGPRGGSPKEIIEWIDLLSSSTCGVVVFMVVVIENYKHTSSDSPG